MKQKSNSLQTAAWLALAGVLLLSGIYVMSARAGMFQLSHAELLSKYTTPESKFVQVQGMDVHYMDEGQGPVVLLLHGSFGSVRTWDDVVPALKDRFRLIRLDQPSSALSGDIPVSASNLSLKDFIYHFLDEVGVEKVSLVGTSSGGIIAYRFASEYPERTRALVIANSPSAVVDNAAVERPPTLDAMILLSNRVLSYQPKIYWRLLLESLYAKPSRLKPDTVNQYFDFGRKARTAAVPPSLFARVNDNAEIDRILGSIFVPTLLLWGVPDPVLPENMAHQLKSKLKAAPTELVFLHGTGHYPPVESPLLVAEHVGRFLTVVENQNTRELRP